MTEGVLESVDVGTRIRQQLRGYSFFTNDLLQTRAMTIILKSTIGFTNTTCTEKPVNTEGGFHSCSLASTQVSRSDRRSTVRGITSG